MVSTSNGQNEGHTRVPSPRAPSLIAVNKHTGEVVWRAIGAGGQVLHGQWSSPVAADVNSRDVDKRQYHARAEGAGQGRQNRPRRCAGGVIYECGNGSRYFMYPSPGAGTSKASTAFWSVADEGNTLP